MSSKQTLGQASLAPETFSPIVIKRDGSKQDFDEAKIRAAVSRAYDASGTRNQSTQPTDVVDAVLHQLLNDGPDTLRVEDIQKAIEQYLISMNLPDVARAFIEYRTERDIHRRERRKPNNSAIADYIHACKYSKYSPTLKRRETRQESIDRRMLMDLRKFPYLEDDIRTSFAAVSNQEVLASMRSMQFGGHAIEVNNNRIYNCSFTLVDRMEAFSEAFYLLLCGCGVGYSVQFQHVEKLPDLRFIDKTKVVHYVVRDTIEGWADAAKALLHAYVKGHYIEFSYSKIREVGIPLKTSGGKAPGHLPLKVALEAIRTVLDKSQGRQLRPIECHHIMCYLAQGVLSGGIRRSSLIALFSFDDGEMMICKTGDWYKTSPHLALSNNSVALLRSDCRKPTFRRIFKLCREFGEPGIIFLDNLDYGFNPCGEICLNPVLEITEETLKLIREWVAEDPGSRSVPKAAEKIGNKFTGFGFCNLTTVNVANCKDEEDFYRRCRAASVIGTCQAAYTSLKYISWVSQIIVRREALLGVSMTGMTAKPDLAFNPDVLRKGAEIVNATNVEIAGKIGIQPAARSTAVKPEGTGTLWLGGFAHGINPVWCRRGFRRVTANPTESVFQYFRKHNPHMCERKPSGDYVIVFPFEVQDNATTKDEMHGLGFLERVLTVYENWIKPGCLRPDASPGAMHNVSCTCPVKDEDWDSVYEFVWENRERFGALAFLPWLGDKVYEFAPQEEVTTEADEVKWNNLIEHYKPVDYSKMVELEDGTDLAGEAACMGGQCVI